MRKSFVALLLLVGATATLASAAFASIDDGTVNAKLMNAQMARELQSRVAKLGTSAVGDTTWVGYNPAFAGPTNYWAVGVGANRPVAGANNARRGYWDWDTPVNGDTLQGWWPMRTRYTTTGGLTLADNLRPWWGLDFGNQVNYVINQGAANKRTFGVTGVWHSDPGGNNTAVASPLPGTNPHQPNWLPLGGTRSAWCGLRGHGDRTVVDPITGNGYSSEAQQYDIANGAGNGTGTSNRYPGYSSQWDQMLYRDIDLTGATGPNVTVSFKLRTRMSTGKGSTASTRTGWFDKDPKAVVAGNYIQSSGNTDAPIDSFMVYVGKPNDPDGNSTNANDFVASDGLSYDIFDAQRRWFSEVIATQGGSAANTHHELFTTSGDHDSTVTVSIPLASLTPYGSKARLVFRVKTNQGFDDETGSNSGSYNSNGMGAAQIDDITVNKGSGAASFGDFENASDIDNNTAVSATTKWKSTGKPPAIFAHVRNISELIYQDLCGAPGSINRICNMFGNVVSDADFDNSEATGGVFGTPEQERLEGIVSPTINLKTPAVGTNEIGLDAATAVPTEDFYARFDIYTGVFDIFTQGNGYQYFIQSYPSTQRDTIAVAGASKKWGEYVTPPFQEFNPDKQCYSELTGYKVNGMIVTSNPGLQPDSVRVGIRKLQQCFRFGISANCGQTLGAYYDNFSLGIVDGQIIAISVNIWDWINDTFPANEDSGLPGLAAFDTCGALIKTGLNTAQATGDLSRFDIPGDSVTVNSQGANIRVDMVFRILPGPGDYVTVGDRTSGLRRRPDQTAGVTSGDGSFWATYIANNGPFGTGGNGTTGPGHPAAPTFGRRWSELTWNSARCDTVDFALFPTLARNLGATAVGAGAFASMLHESDPNFNSLGLARNRCFLNDTLGPATDITCGRPGDPTFPPAWVTTLPASRTGWDGTNTTKEGTKIIPDGLLTPGSHVQYFFRRGDLSGPAVDLVPDTSTVYTQPGEGPSFDAHRWQEFSVLPDAWKKSAYGGLGQACMLYVDWNDRRGDEMIWVSTADSIGATRSTKWGAHNGWHAAGKVSVNDPAGFVYNLNAQPGTTWDMYGVKAAESLNTGSGSLGSRLAFRDESNPANKAAGYVAKNAPTVAMLEAYYRILMILTGDLNSSIMGPFNDKSSDDEGIISQFILGATSGAHRGVFFEGHGFVESLDGDPWLDNFGVALRNSSYKSLSANASGCADLIAQSPITTNGDIYGIQNLCTYTLDVLSTSGADAVPSMLYQPVGAPANFPYIAGVFKDAIAPNYWQSVVDGWDPFNMRGRFCEKTYGRLAYDYNVFSHVFGAICAVQGTPVTTLDTPNNDNGKSFVDFMTVRGNPLVKGSAVIAFGLPATDKVSLKVFDVSGRLVRTLADGQIYKAGEHQLLWDGVDNHGRQVARGVYFASYTTERGVSKSSKITVVLQ